MSVCLIGLLDVVFPVYVVVDYLGAGCFVCIVAIKFGYLLIWM